MNSSKAGRNHSSEVEFSTQSEQQALTPEEYIERRVDDQIGWYDRKSATAQAVFKRLRRAEIVFAALLPFLAGVTDVHEAMPYVLGLFGVVVVVLAAFQSLGQHQENWIEYRTTCESLRHEKYLFLTGTRPYDGDDAFPRFVESIESLISKENTAWSQHIRDGVEKSLPTPEEQQVAPR